MNLSHVPTTVLDHLDRARYHLDEECHNSAALHLSDAITHTACTAGTLRAIAAEISMEAQRREAEERDDHRRRANWLADWTVARTDHHGNPARPNVHMNGMPAASRPRPY